MPTLPGPTSQTPLLQAKFVVFSVGGDGVAAVADAAPPRLAATTDPVTSSALSSDRMTTSPRPQKRPVSALAGCGGAPGTGQRIYLSGTGYVQGGQWDCCSALRDTSRPRSAVIPGRARMSQVHAVLLLSRFPPVSNPYKWTPDLGW